jgi:hypothetical protein
MENPSFEGGRALKNSPVSYFSASPSASLQGSTNHQSPITNYQQLIIKHSESFNQ